MNQVALTAAVVEVRPLRYTPAGLPALEMLLSHESEVVEAKVARRVEFVILAVALGDVALLLVDTPLGASLSIQGFLAPVRKGASKLVLHVQQAGRVYAGSATVTV